MYVIRMPSEGGRSADYERRSRRSKKQIFHDTVLSSDLSRLSQDGDSSATRCRLSSTVLDRTENPMHKMLKTIKSS
jgi:hypothetical protein